MVTRLANGYTYNYSFANKPLSNKKQKLVALPDALYVLNHLAQIHPAGQRFWYLVVLGVEPSEQRSGLGSALLKTGLRVCDEQGLGAYPETAEPASLPFYSAHGFDVIWVCAQPPDDGRGSPGDARATRSRDYAIPLLRRMWCCSTMSN
jgi:GNAT superfamily N-acetyltransferase